MNHYTEMIDFEPSGSNSNEAEEPPKTMQQVEPASRNARELQESATFDLKEGAD